MSFEEMERELLRLKALIEDNADEQIKQRRSYEDILQNLSYENMPSVKQDRETTVKKVSRLSSTVDGVAEHINKIEQSVDEQGSRISLIVVKLNGKDVIDAASIIGAINEEGSSIKLNADKISFEGSDISFDTSVLNINSDGCVQFDSPISTTSLYADNANFQGRVDMGSDDGRSGFIYLNCAENNTLELCGDGGIILCTDTEGGGPGGSVSVVADGLYVNGRAALTRSEEDIAYLRRALGL